MAIFLELPVLNPSPSTDPARPISPSRAAAIPPLRKPDWLRIRPPGGENYLKIKGMLKERKLHTVCEEAHCPNVAECWASGTATFMLGGDICTRACRFCAIKTARIPPPLDPNEPAHIAESIADLGLHYVVLTSVDRDDLKDGGAGHFAEAVREIKKRDSHVMVETLVPDFRGNFEAVESLVHSGVDVYAHNVETVRRLQYRVRDPRAGYEQSLATLRAAKAVAREQKRGIFTKTSLMLGLGETEEEILQAMDDMLASGVDVLTLGQYLRPSMQHLPVERYVSPEEFENLAKIGKEKGFFYVASGPMVRSSYRAAEFFMLENRREKMIDAI